MIFLSFSVCSQSQTRSSLNSTRQVPEWARQAVWYQIFPERFRNGDASNDPRVKDILGSWPHEPPKTWKVSSWTGDWYKLQPWEAGDDKGFYYHVQQRRYGGDLQGVLEKLDYLSGLGITAIYFTPLFQSPSSHKYDAAMYHHIDKNFGPDPDGDQQILSTEDPGDPRTWKWTSADRLFLKLIQEAHFRNIKVVIDGVFNHVGMTFWAFEDLKKNQQNSAYKNWFTVKKWDDPATPQNEFDYAGWFGVRELPELRKDDPGVKDHIRAIVRRWMDPNADGDPSDGVDGWRLDAADRVPLSFWKEFRTWVRGINPQAYLVGEIWWEDWSNDKMYNATPWLHGDAFDAVMNYRWAREVFRYFLAGKDAISVSEFDRRLADLRHENPPECNEVLMNLLDSHDTDRLSSRIANPDLKYDHNVGLHDNPDYDAQKPGPDALRTLRLITLFQMTSVGAPMIYYGDEAGMWGGDDPDCRKPMLWADLKYENETSHPLGKKRTSDTNEFDPDLFGYYRKLISIRRGHEALSVGDFESLLTDDGKDIYVFLRSWKDERVMVAINNSKSKQELDLTLSTDLQSRRWYSLLNSGNISPLNAKLHIVLDPKSGEILAGRTL